MQGFCGWLNFDSTLPSAAEIVRRMAGGELNAEIAADQRWAIKYASRPIDGLSVNCSHGGISVVEGNPAPGDTELAALIDQHGLAKACQMIYQQNGAGFIADLHGPFCMAIFLNRESKALLAFDRIGIHPIYYSQNAAGLAFASRLDHLHGCSRIDLEIDQQSVYDYLYYHVIPSPNTIYKNIKSLTPGSYLEVERGSNKTETYWRPDFSQENTNADLNNLKNDFREILHQCVETESDLTADVGCFLSGGTDSSTLAGFLGDVTKSNVSTYSIGFDQKGFDEMKYARIAARHFQTDHHEYYVSPKDILKLVPEIARAYGQPFGNSSVIPTYYCAQMAAADGKKRILGGDGGDELFGGNERYASQVLFSYYSRIPESLRQNVIEPLANGFPFGEHILPVRKLRRYIDQARIPLPDRLQTYGFLDFLGQDTMLDPAFLTSVDTKQSLRSLQEAYADIRARHIIDKMLVLDMKLTLCDNDLPKVSRMCELAGIAVGFPFLREPMVEFAARLPAHFKVRGLNIRWFFKEALRDYLPEAIIKKSKHGFGLPFGDWLVSHDGLRNMAFDSLASLKKRQIVRADFLDDLRDHKIFEHPHYFGGMVWLLMILEQWFDRHSRSS